LNIFTQSMHQDLQKMENELQEQRIVTESLQKTLGVTTPGEMLPAAQDLVRSYRKVRKELDQLRKSLEEALKAKQEAVASHQATVDTLSGVIARQTPVFVHVKSGQRSQTRKRPRDESPRLSSDIGPSSSSHRVSRASMSSSEPLQDVPVESPGVPPVETTEDIQIETTEDIHVEVTGDIPVEIPSAVPVEFPGAQPVETPEDIPVETPRNPPVEAPTVPKSPPRVYYPPPLASVEPHVVVLGSPGATPVFIPAIPIPESEVGNVPYFTPPADSTHRSTPMTSV
jgi:hypothetical protein